MRCGNWKKGGKPTSTDIVSRPFSCRAAVHRLGDLVPASDDDPRPAGARARLLAGAEEGESGGGGAGGRLGLDQFNPECMMTLLLCLSSAQIERANISHHAPGQYDPSFVATANFFKAAVPLNCCRSPGERFEVRSSNSPLPLQMMQCAGAGPAGLVRGRAPSAPCLRGLRPLVP